jgi:adenosylcobyric acid synthase
VSLAFLDDALDASAADVLVLPGSKQTLDDLAWVRERGFDGALRAHRGPLIGICAGYQMLGLSIDDPAGVESCGISRSAEGLGLLAVRTTMRQRKTVRQAAGNGRGYEIHMGETSGPVEVGGRVWGTYVHGIFDDDAYRHAFLDDARAQCGLAPARVKANVTAGRDARIDRWADHLRRSLNLAAIREWAGLKEI